MATEQYIKELLYRYNCVVVPEFGAFLTQIKSAAIDRATHTFYPPTKVISFNEQLSSNDGLLVSYMANAEKTGYEEMLKQTLKLSGEWKQSLKSGKRLMLDSIGELWLNREGKVQFQPSDRINYLMSSFGLSSFNTTPATREVLKEAVEELESKIPFSITPEQRKETPIRPFLKYAAVFLVALSTGLTGFQFYKETQGIQQVARKDAQEIVSKNIQEATFFNTNPLELPEISLPVAVREVGRHHIIAGAFRIKANADKKVGILKNKGFKAAYLGTNKFGLHQVTYGSYADPKEALIELKKIRRTESPDAWLLSIK